MQLNKYHFYCGLVACADWSCRDQTSPRIAGLLLTVLEGVATITATDGHGIARYQWVEPGLEQYSTVLAKESVNSLIRAIKPSMTSAAKRSDARLVHRVHLEDSKVRIDSAHVEVLIKTLDVEFPPIDQVLLPRKGGPAELPDGLVGIRAELTGRAAQSFLKIAFRGKGSQGLSISLACPLDPIVVTSPEYPELLVVVSPMRL